MWPLESGDNSSDEIDSSTSNNCDYQADAKESQ